jgi:hypothetical protein
MKLEGIDLRTYRGSENPYKVVGKTYRSASEAFKDADYATAIWRCESENERGWRIVLGWGAFILGIGLAYFIAVGVVDWLKSGG